MSRFDDDLRHATGPMAGEPLPPDILDEALDEPRSSASRWPALAAGTALVAVLALAVGVTVGQLLPEPSPDPSSTPAPSDAPVGACEDVLTPGPGEVVFVYFPCGAPSLEQASGVRRVAEDTPIVVRIETALRAVLDGPTALEQERGLTGVAPPGSSVLIASIGLSENDGLAEVDFDPALAEVPNLSTTAAGGAFLRALQETALHFPAVTAVEFRMGGSCDAFFEIFQATCQHFAEPVEEVSDCPIIPPAELPSGAPITEPRLNPGLPRVSWGSGEDTVTQAPGHRDSAPLRDDGTPVTVRGYPGFVRPSGSLPNPLATEIAWLEEGCQYTVLVTLSGGEEAAIDYAARFGPSMAQPSPPLAEPVTASVEEDGLRLTVTLDRDRTVFAQRVIATTTIENIGSDSVFWGHASLCAFPSRVEARPERPFRLEYGREDWRGEEGALKTLTLFPIEADTDPVFPFQLEAWMDSDENLGCTTAPAISELAAGDTLVERRGWDTLGTNGMPPPPGSYTIDTGFGYISRGGERPPLDDITARFTLEIPLTITVEGPEIDHVSPGEAVDAILSDGRFQAQLADVPREQWSSQELMYADGVWELAFYITESDAESEAIVARVDARSGVVLEVGREERDPPPGG
jgi:hypothetical protein